MLVLESRFVHLRAFGPKLLTLDKRRSKTGQAGRKWPHNQLLVWVAWRWLGNGRCSLVAEPVSGGGPMLLSNGRCGSSR